MSTQLESKSNTKSEIKIKKPRLYKVIFFNDNFTPFEFVEKVLTIIFTKTEAEAVGLAKKIDEEGLAVVAVYPREIAQTKQAQTLYNAQQNQFPLRCEIEPEESDEE